MAPDIDLDLDALRAARLESKGPKTIRLGGKDYHLPAELPYEFARLAREGDEEGALRSLLGEQTDAFLGDGEPSQDDLEALILAIPKLYGVGVGESEASAASSKSTSGRSRRTSSGPTGSTSAKSSGARKASASVGS